MRILLLLLFIALSFQSNAQDQTVGLLSYKPVNSYDGYNLIFPHNQSDVFLLDNCGEIVKRWTDDADWRPGNTAYLLEDGRIVKAKRPASVAGNPIWAGGGGGTIEIVDWDNNQEWSYTLNDEFARLHHDFAVMPNGNILMISWELKTKEEAIQAGRDTTLLNQDELWPDFILEVNPSTDEIVWEWHAWDHLIQDFDETKDNYGVVADNKQLINLNWDTNDAKADWMHTNALDYNPELDQILISVPTFHEVWVIDHSTTTEQAASHTGGNSGRGGDLMYRWGNPAAYDTGTEEDQKLFYQHDAHWVDDFVEPTHPNYGEIAVFNNRVGADFSTVNTWKSSWDMYKGAYLEDEDVYLPFEFETTRTHPVPQEMYSTGLSSFQHLPNGNVLICTGRFGYSFELTPDDELAWEYKTPLLAGVPVTQGDTLEINNNLTFRMTRYPIDYEGFDGKEFDPQGYLELEPDSTYCDLVLSTNVIEGIPAPSLYPNPADDMVTIEWTKSGMVDISIYDINGRLQKQMNGMGGRKFCDLSDMVPGIYLLQVDDSGFQKLLVQ